MTAVSPRAGASGVERHAAAADALLTGLYERHASRVFSYCLNWLRSREEAEDAVQTTFLYAFRGLERGVLPMHERPWLLSIARNVCLSRSDAVRRRAVEVPQDPSTLEQMVGAPPASADELEGLTEGLAALTEQQRQAILLREWQGLSYREIAERLELSQAAVETLLFRARRSLARRVRRPLGVGSLLPWLRSLTAGGTAKLVLGAAAVAITATTGAIAITHQPRRPAQAHMGSSIRISRPRVESAKSTRSRIATTTRTKATTPAVRLDDPHAPQAAATSAAAIDAGVAQPVAGVPQPAHTTSVVATPVTSVPVTGPTAASTTAVQTVASSVTEVADNASTIVSAVTSTAATAATNAGRAADTAANTVGQTAVTTVTNTAAAAQTAAQTGLASVTTLLAPHLLP